VPCHDFGLQEALRRGATSGSLQRKQDVAAFGKQAERLSRSGWMSTAAGGAVACDFTSFPSSSALKPVEHLLDRFKRRPGAVTQVVKIENGAFWKTVIPV
jgi:hypothetical protein